MSSSSTDGGQPLSRASTPATDVSPPRTPEFVLPPPSPEALRRRAQSDRASSEIGARMLKGWAMLSDECINDECWAIPLVRPPRARPGAQPDPRKECVICGTVYISGENGELIIQSTRAAPGNAATASGSHRPSGTTIERPTTTTQTTIQDVPRESLASTAPPAPAIVPTATNPLPSIAVVPSKPSTQQSAVSTPFGSAAGALQGALDSLSQRLTQITLGPNIDVNQVKDTAEAMEAVMKSMHTAQQLSGGV